MISAVVTKFCVTPELFAVPAPLTVNVNVGPTVIVNALAPALNTMPFTSVLAERETPVVLDKANVAVSDGPLGGPPAVQLIAVFQSPELGFFFQVALPAKVLLAVESRSSNIAAVRNNNGNRRCRRGEGTASDIDEERRIMSFIICFVR